MPEPLPPGLPGRITPPSSPARSFEAALGSATRRRRRRAVGVSGSALAVLLAAATAAIVLPTAPGGDRLSVAATDSTTAEPTPSAAPQSDPEPSAAPAEQAPEPGASPEPRATSEAGGPGPQRTPQAGPAEEAEPTTPPEQAPPQDTGRTAAPPPAARPAEAGPPSERTPMRQGETCDGSGPTPAHGWCSYYDGALEAAQGQTVILAAAICRIPGQGAGTLVADDGRHADFAAGRRSFPPSWSWGHGRRFSSDGASFTVQPGECIRWFVTWNLTDDAGDPLPPGEYYLAARPQVTARATAGGTSANASNNETFRITG